MTCKEVASLVNKRPGTVAIFFSRHRLSFKSLADVRFYLDYNSKGKRLEKGKRTTDHLKKYQFKSKDPELFRARNLVNSRHLMWYSDTDNLSLDSIVEHVLMYGDYEDFMELEKIVGNRSIRSVFCKQINAKRVNYRPQTLNYFKHYLNLT